MGSSKARPEAVLALDLGSRVTRAAVGLLEGEQLRLLGVGESVSEGWTRGRISDQNSVTASILAAVGAAERSAQIPSHLAPGSAVLGLGGPAISGVNNRRGYDVGYPREITSEDVRHVMKRVAQVPLAEDRMVLRCEPQDFIVDGNSGYHNPCGATGSLLEACAHILTFSEQEHDRLVGAANLAHLSVDETVFEPLAAFHASVLSKDRHGGVVTIDIGAHSTDLAVYYGEALCQTASLPICGEHFSRDVAKGLKVTYEEAESLKRQYGCALTELSGDHVLIEVPSPEGRAPRETPCRELNVILEARAEELFSYVQRELAEAGLERDLMFAVLCGGGARLPGMCEMAERVLNCHARNGLAQGIVDWLPYLNNPAWTVLGGLLMWAARLKLHNAAGQRGNGLISGIWR